MNTMNTKIGLPSKDRRVFAGASCGGGAKKQQRPYPERVLRSQTCHQGLSITMQLCFYCCFGGSQITHKEAAVTSSVFREHDEPGAAALLRAGWGSAVPPVPTGVLPSPRILLFHAWSEVPVWQRFRRTSRQQCTCNYANDHDGRRRGGGRCWLWSGVGRGLCQWRRWNRRVWTRARAWIPGSTNSLPRKRNGRDNGSAFVAPQPSPLS